MTYDKILTIDLSKGNFEFEHCIKFLGVLQYTKDSDNDNNFEYVYDSYGVFALMFKSFNNKILANLQETLINAGLKLELG